MSVISLKLTNMKNTCREKKMSNKKELRGEIKKYKKILFNCLKNNFKETSSKCLISEHEVKSWCDEEKDSNQPAFLLPRTPNAIQLFEYLLDEYNKITEQEVSSAIYKIISFPKNDDEKEIYNLKELHKKLGEFISAFEINDSKKELSDKLKDFFKTKRK